MAEYDFYKKELWTGRLTSFTETIDSNLRLLRIILLTKGSSIMEFGLLLDNGENLLNESESDTVELRKKIDDSRQEIRKGWVNVRKNVETVNSFLNPPSDSAKIGIGKVTLGSRVPKKIKDPVTDISETVNQISHHIQMEKEEVVQFNFEDTQLNNLRMLSLSQQAFVKGRLETCVKKMFTDASHIPNVNLIQKSYRKIATDIEIVQRAIVQRVHEIGDNGTYTPSMQAQALQTTDKLALMALAPFKHLLPDNSKITPITYFSQETHIQRVPYCDDVVLIGIRHDQVLQEIDDAKPTPPPPFELLAIPHEIGHYIYHRANIETYHDFVQQVIREEFKSNDWSFKVIDSEEKHDAEYLNFEEISMQLPPLTDESHRKWCEEIFSDLCGCLVAGPLAAMGLQSMLSSRVDVDEEGDHHEHDEVHPPVELRPFILSEILKELHKLWPKQYNFDSEANLLSKNWENILVELGHPVKELEVNKELDAIRPIIRVFARVLLHAYISPTDTLPSYDIWKSKEEKGLKANSSKEQDLKYYASELTSITQEGPDLKELQPSELGKPSTQEGMDTNEGVEDINDLLNEWEKKGPVTIGGH